MRIGIATHRTLIVLLLVLLVVLVLLARDDRIKEAGITLAAMVAIVIAQALMLRCQHCGARTGLRMLTPGALLRRRTFPPRKCFRCHKPLSVTKEANGAV